MELKISTETLWNDNGEPRHDITIIRGEEKVLPGELTKLEVDMLRFIIERDVIFKEEE